MEKKNKGYLDNWSLYKKTSGGIGICATSQYGFLKTSRIVKIDFELMICETKNSLYKLGELMEFKNGK